jgi:hypothetical protein
MFSNPSLENAHAVLEMSWAVAALIVALDEAAIESIIGW